ncbi:MAG TPA: cellulose synthase subunit BcsC-related outer membrane protein, partial [Bordetella sp.]
DTSHGMELMRPLMPNGTASSRPGVLLPYAGMLIKTKQDAEAANVLRQLQNQNLTRDQRHQFNDLVNLYAVRLADRQRQQGNLAAAYDTLTPMMAKRPNDNLVAGAMARLYTSDGKYDEALDLYKQMQARDPDNANVQISTAFAASQVQDYGYADQALDHAVAVAPDDPDVLAGAARVYLMRGKSGKAATLLESAIAIKEKRLAAQPAQPTQLAAAPSRAETPANPAAVASEAAARAPAPGPVAASEKAISPVPASASSATYTQPRPSTAAPVVVSATAQDDDPSSLATMKSELIGIREARSPEIRAGVFMQSNNGASGTSKLTALQEPMEARMPVGEGKLVVRVTPVQLKSGSVGSDAYSSSQFGGGPVAAQAQAAGSVGAPRSQRASGVGLALGYEARDWMADLGTTPLGFEHTNVVGGAELRGAINPQKGSWYTVGASRRAVTDSVTSFAGTRDSRTGDSWGGVTATGVHGQIGVDRPAGGAYAYGSFASLNGKNVASNTRAEVGTGVYWYLQRSANSLLTAGLNLGGMFYNKNESSFTYGNGGYFSPQSFYSLSVPVTWAQRSDRFSYKLQGSVGLQHYRASSEPYFPTSSAMQSAAVSAASAIGLSDNAIHPGQSSTGIGYSLSAAGEYRLTRNLTMGAVAGMNNASSYRQWVGGLYLRYSFYPQTQSMDMPVAPYHSPYSSQ